MKIYTDIDYVLHDYTPKFLEAALQYFKIKEPPKPIVTPEGAFYPSLAPVIEAFQMSDDLVWHLVRIANELPGHIPTPCFHPIMHWIRSKIWDGADVVAVTARATRMNAEEMIFDCLGPEVPVITVDTPYKHLVIEDNSIYFEDHPAAIEGVLKHRKNVTIVVPKWPWNLDIPKHKNIIHCNPHEFSGAIDLIEERLYQYV